MRPLEEVIGHRFKNPRWLEEALSHKSYAAEAGSGLHNERLEFLGDSVLSAVMAHKLYRDNPDEDEGSLSQKKSWLVSRPNPSKLAQQMELGQYLRLGIGEEASGGRERLSLLGNALEALIGAVYLDGGYSAAQDFIERVFARYGGEVLQEDHKSRLQEILQKKHKAVPVYEVSSETGPDHDKTFSVRVLLGKKILGEGLGKSKKEAEQSAAQSVLAKLKEE